MASGCSLCYEVCEVELGFRSFILVEALAKGGATGFGQWKAFGVLSRITGGGGLMVCTMSQGVDFTSRRETSPLL